MGQKINIPSQNQPFRKQSSLGGDVSFRNLNGTNDNSFITLAKVTKVYYKQGKLDFKLTNTVSIVQEQGGDGSGSAPIPVDFFGRKPDGQVFGHYRPVKVGDLIAIAYINGHRSNPIVIGVYPDSAPDYEMISPSMFETGDDNDSGIAETGLAEQKVYPSMQTSYRSGSGTIAEALNGHSFLILDDETANQYDQLWTDYESVGFFNHDGETTNPLKEEAGSWLLVHEDNPDGDGDNHRTRFYVNPKGEIQIVLMGSNSEGDVSVLEGSRKDGFTLKHYNDLSSIKAGDKGQDVYNPDFDVAKKYVELNIGKDQSILMQAVDQGFSGGNTSLTVKPDGVYLNDKPLNASITDSVREHSKEVADAISKDLTSTKEWEDFDKRVTQAGKDAKDAGDKAKQAGEDAKQAGISAEKAGEDAKKTGEDIKRHIVYYASAFPQGDHYIPGKYLAINTETYIANGIIKSAMIEDGAIDHAKIASEAVGSSQIEDAAITRAKIADLAVGSAQIEDASITDEKVGKLSFDHMIGATLDAGQITVINLTADNIKAHSLVADNLDISKLSDIADNVGTIVGGQIKGATITGNTIIGGTISGSDFRTLNGQNILSTLSRPYFSDKGSKSFRISKSGLLTAENSVTKVPSNISSYTFTVGGNKGTFSNYIGYSGSTKNLTTDFYRYGVAQQESPSTQGVVGYYYYGNDNVPDGRADPKGTVILPVAWIKDNPGISYMYLQYYLGVDASNVVNGNFRMVAFSTNYKPFSFSHDSTTGFDYLSSFNYDQFSFSNTDIEGKYIRSNNFHVPTGMDALYMDEFDLSSFPVGSDICFGIAIYPEQVADKHHPWGVSFTLESFIWGSVNAGDITLNVNGSHGSNVSSQSLNISNNGALSMEYVGDSSGGTNVDYSYINMNKGMIDLTASQPGYGTWKTMKTTISGTGIDFNTFNVDDPNNVHPITFRGTVTNTGGQTGIQFNGYGNIIANQASSNWSINVPSSTTPGQWTKVLQVPLKEDLPFEFHPEDIGNYGFLRLGWVKFKQSWCAGQKVPAIYNISDGHVAGIAIWSRYVTAFVDGWGLNLTDHNTPIAAGERVGVDVVGWSAGIP